MQNNAARTVSPSFERSVERVTSTPSTEEMLEDGEVEHQVEASFDSPQLSRIPMPYSGDDDATPLSSVEEHGLAHLDWYFRNLGSML